MYRTRVFFSFREAAAVATSLREIVVSFGPSRSGGALDWAHWRGQLRQRAGRPVHLHVSLSDVHADVLKA